MANAKVKLRLVIDLRYFNQFLPEWKFKYEGLNLVPQMFRNREFFFTFDLKSGYHHVDIHPKCWVFHGAWMMLGSSICSEPFPLALHQPVMPLQICFDL